MLDWRAERWGAWTDEAEDAIDDGDDEALAWIISQAKPDISFGPGQKIVQYAPVGDQTHTVANCLFVRQYIFDHREQATYWAAQQLASILPYVDNDPLRAMVVYNSGGDNLFEDWYRAKHAGNIKRYEHALEIAEGFRWR
ncbi:MAG: hypothetical protein NTZ05_01895 [Chloroflexi bacterium]|nr:hypothetical protein [Chloroflexota bacterium]